MSLTEVQNGRESPRTTAYLLAGLVALAAALRFARLGHWAFDSDEIFMLRDSLHPRLTNPRPLLYLINHYVVLPLRPLDELGLRLLPALFGTLAIPVLYWVGRRLLDARAALLGSLLLTFSGLHVIYSQFGRYWSLVFLLSAVYPYALFLGVRERDYRILGLGVVTAVLASLAHPVSVLLLGGPLIWLLVTYVRPRHLRSLWGQRSLRWGALLLLALTVGALVRFVPLLEGWIAVHDANPGTCRGCGQYLLRAKFPVGLQQLTYLLTFAEGWTLSLMLAGLVGLYLLWSSGDRLLAAFLTSLALFPLVFLPLISIRTPVSTYYLIPTAPVFFLTAGHFLDRLFTVDVRVRPRWLLPATVTALVLLPGMPTLVSQYLNGRRFDFRGAALWLRPRLTPNDMIFSEQAAAMSYYLPQARVDRLSYDTISLGESLRRTQRAGGGAAVWIVPPAPAHAFRTNLKQGGLASGIFDNCQLRNSVGTGRVDFRQQYLQVFHCPPGRARELTGGQEPPVAELTPAR